MSGLLSDAEVERARDGTDLAALIGAEVVLKRSGSRLVGLCPFHEEKTPSFSVDPGRNKYRCWGCGAHGDAINWLEERQGLSFRNAVLRLLGRDGSSPAQSRAVATRPPESAVARSIESVPAGVAEALRRAADSFQYGLSRSPWAADYLHGERGLGERILAKFGVGAVGSGVSPVLERRGISREALCDAGLLVEGRSGRWVDLFRHRIVFPIRNSDGVVAGFGGRAAPNWSGPRYLNSPESSWFQKSELIFGLREALSGICSDRTAVAVEGYIDVLQAHQFGERRAIGVMGTALNARHINRLLSVADRIVVVLDGDVAGRSAVRHLADAQHGVGSGAWVLIAELPDGDDPDKFLRREGLSAWRDMLAAARPLDAFRQAEAPSHECDKGPPRGGASDASKRMRAKCGMSV